MFAVLKHLFKQSIKDESAAKLITKSYDYQYLSDNSLQELLKEFENLHPVPCMRSEELKQLLTPRYREEAKAITEGPLSQLEEVLIDSICSPHVIEMIKKEFFKRYKEFNK